MSLSHHPDTHPTPRHPTYSRNLSRPPTYESLDTPSTNSLYASTLDSCYHNIIQIYHSSDWVKEKPTRNDDSSCEIWSQTPPGSNVRATRGHCRFRTASSAEEFSRFVTQCTIEGELKRRYFAMLEPSYNYYERLHSFTHAGVDNAGGLVHFLFDPKNWLVSKRDFVIVRARRVAKKEDWIHPNSETWVSYGCSLPNDLTTKDPYPAEQGAVRALVSWSAWFIWKEQEIDEEKGILHVEFFSHSDPAGSIPVMLINRKTREKALGVARYVRTFLKYQKDCRVEPGLALPSLLPEAKKVESEEEGDEGDGEVGVERKDEETDEEEEGEVDIVDEEEGEVQPEEYLDYLEEEGSAAAAAAADATPALAAIPTATPTAPSLQLPQIDLNVARVVSEQISGIRARASLAGERIVRISEKMYSLRSDSKRLLKAQARESEILASIQRTVSMERRRHHRPSPATRSKESVQMEVKANILSQNRMIVWLILALLLIYVLLDAGIF